MLNYFDQPHYSYVKKKSILAGFCAFIALFWKKKKKCFRSLVCIVHQQLIRMGFGAGEAGRGPTPKPQAQVLYIGRHWLVPPCVFLTVVRCSEKCRDPTLSCPLLLAAMQASCKGPVTQTQADG